MKYFPETTHFRFKRFFTWGDDQRLMVFLCYCTVLMHAKDNQIKMASARRKTIPFRLVH